jgi:hypothetical protein
MGEGEQRMRDQEFLPPSQQALRKARRIAAKRAAAYERERRRLERDEYRRQLADAKTRLRSETVRLRDVVDTAVREERDLRRRMSEAGGGASLLEASLARVTGERQVAEMALAGRVAADGSPSPLTVLREEIARIEQDWAIARTIRPEKPVEPESAWDIDVERSHLRHYSPSGIDSNQLDETTVVSDADEDESDTRVTPEPQSSTQEPTDDATDGLFVETLDGSAVEDQTHPMTETDEWVNEGDPDASVQEEAEPEPLEARYEDALRAVTALDVPGLDSRGGDEEFSGEPVGASDQPDRRTRRADNRERKRQRRVERSIARAERRRQRQIEREHAAAKKAARQAEQKEARDAAREHAAAEKAARQAEQKEARDAAREHAAEEKARRIADRIAARDAADNQAGSEKADRAAERNTAREQAAAEKARRKEEKAAERDAARKQAAEEKTRREADRIAARDAAENQAGSEKADRAAERKTAREQAATEKARRKAERVAAREQAATEKARRKEKKAAERIAARKQAAEEKARRKAERKSEREAPQTTAPGEMSDSNSEHILSGESAGQLSDDIGAQSEEQLTRAQRSALRKQRASEKAAERAARHHERRRAREEAATARKTEKEQRSARRKELKQQKAEERRQRTEDRKAARNRNRVDDRGDGQLQSDPVVLVADHDAVAMKETMTVVLHDSTVETSVEGAGTGSPVAGATTTGLSVTDPSDAATVSSERLGTDDIDAVEGDEHPSSVRSTAEAVTNFQLDPEKDITAVETDISATGDDFTDVDSARESEAATGRGSNRRWLRWIVTKRETITSEQSEGKTLTREQRMAQREEKRRAAQQAKDQRYAERQQRKVDQARAKQERSRAGLDRKNQDRTERAAAKLRAKDIEERGKNERAEERRRLRDEREQQKRDSSADAHLERVIDAPAPEVEEITEKLGALSAFKERMSARRRLRAELIEARRDRGADTTGTGSLTKEERRKLREQLAEERKRINDARREQIRADKDGRRERRDQEKSDRKAAKAARTQQQGERQELERSFRNTRAEEKARKKDAAEALKAEERQVRELRRREAQQKREDERAAQRAVKAERKYRKEIRKQQKDKANQQRRLLREETKIAKRARRIEMPEIAVSRKDESGLGPAYQWDAEVGLYNSAGAGDAVNASDFDLPEPLPRR